MFKVRKKEPLPCKSVTKAKQRNHAVLANHVIDLQAQPGTSDSKPPTQRKGKTGRVSSSGAENIKKDQVAPSSK